MIKVIVCDDNKEELKSVEAMLIEFDRLFANNDLWVKTFDNPLEMLAVTERESFDIYILDVLMPGMNGIEVGKSIRKIDREAHIVYTTTETRFALQSFKVMPFQYLIKPLGKEQLFFYLKQILQKIQHSQLRKFSVKTKNGLLVFTMAQIVCVEYQKPCCLFSLSGGKAVKSVAEKSSFSDTVQPLLNDKRFIRPHISFVCNMKFVEKFTSSQFLMTNGTTVPISKNIYSAVKKTYFDFLFGE